MEMILFLYLLNCNTNIMLNFNSVKNAYCQCAIYFYPYGWDNMNTLVCT